MLQVADNAVFWQNVLLYFENERRKERKVNRKIKREEERKRNKYEEINMNDQHSYTFNLQCDYSYEGRVTKFSTNLRTKYRGG